MEYGEVDRCMWSMESFVGVLSRGGVEGRVDAARPELGLQGLRVEGCKVDGDWFGVSRDGGTPSWPLSVAETYARGGDLVASYQASSDWPYAPQIYWRAGRLDAVSGVVASLSVLVSVQTHLLDTFPRIVVESIFGAREVFQLVGGNAQSIEVANRGELAVQPSAGICCMVRRLVDQPLSYAEFVPASDFRTARVLRGDDGNCGVRWELFAEFLEKGVIRRARVHGAFLRRENDLEVAAACCAEIEREALPLTT